MTRRVPAAMVLAAFTIGVEGRADLLVCSNYDRKILRYDAGTGDYLGVFATFAGYPSAMTVGRDGSLWVTSGGLDDPKELTRLDQWTGAVLGSAAVPDSFGLAYLATGPDGDLYGTSFVDNRITRHDGLTGSYLGEFVAAGSGGLSGATGLTFGPDGNLYVSSRNTGQVLRYDGTTGAFLDVFAIPGGNGTSGPQDLEFRPDGYLYVAEEWTDTIMRFDAVTGASAGIYATSSQNGDGMSFAFDDAGILYVTRQYANAVGRHVSGVAAGDFITAAGGGLNYPVDLLFNTPVPEPSALVLLAVGAGVLSRRRRS